MYLFDLGHSAGGGCRGSIANRNVCSIKLGINLFNKLQEVSRQGFIFTSINNGSN